MQVNSNFCSIFAQSSLFLTFEQYFMYFTTIIFIFLLDPDPHFLGSWTSGSAFRKTAGSGSAKMIADPQPWFVSGSRAQFGSGSKSFTQVMLLKTYIKKLCKNVTGREFWIQMVNFCLSVKPSFLFFTCEAPDPQNCSTEPITYPITADCCLQPGERWPLHGDWPVPGRLVQAGNIL